MGGAAFPRNACLTIDNSAVILGPCKLSAFVGLDLTNHEVGRRAHAYLVRADLREQGDRHEGYVLHSPDTSMRGSCMARLTRETAKSWEQVLAQRGWAGLN